MAALRDARFPKREHRRGTRRRSGSLQPAVHERPRRAHQSHSEAVSRPKILQNDQGHENKHGGCSFFTEHSICRTIANYLIWMSTFQIVKNNPVPERFLKSRRDFDNVRLVACAACALCCAFLAFLSSVHTVLLPSRMRRLIVAFHRKLNCFWFLSPSSVL